MPIPRVRVLTSLVAGLVAVGGLQLGAMAPVHAADRVASAPGKPVATAGVEQAKISWRAPFSMGTGTFVKYEVVTASGAAACESSDKTVRTCTALDLTGGTPYQFKVRAVTSVGNGKYSLLSKMVTPTSVPTAPAKPVATAGDGSAMVDWEAPSDFGTNPFTKYEVYGPGPTKVCETNAIDATECTVVGLTNGTGYWFAVRAVTTAGPGALSPSSDTVVPASTPAAPAAVYASAGVKKAGIFWAAPSTMGSGSFLKYEVVTASGDAACESTDESVRSCIALNLTAGTPYQFKVRAVTDAGNGAYSVLTNPVTPTSVPTAPAKPVATAGNASAKVDWEAPSDFGTNPFTKYEVYGPGPTKVCETTAIDATECTATGLTNGAAYWFAVRAVTTAGPGALSPSSNVVIPGP